VVLVVAGLITFGADALPGFAFFTGLVILPIGVAVWMGVGAGRQTDRRLRLRVRPLPRLPRGLAVVEDSSFELSSIDLPLFSRPLATLWTSVATVSYEDRSLRLFDVVHADMFGEGSVSRTATAEAGTPGAASGMSIVTCALALVDADMPLIVVRPRREKPFTLPAQLREYDTELGEFNRGFRLFSEDAYAATAIVDQRTIQAIQGFDPRTAIEIGGSAILLYTSRRDSSLRLIQQAANLARTFPSVVTSLFPAVPPAQRGGDSLSLG
jgi:hypothetical protein